MRYLILGRTWIGEVKASQDGRIVAYVFRYGMIPSDEFRRLTACNTVEDLKNFWPVQGLEPAEMPMKGKDHSGGNVRGVKHPPARLHPREA